jgi:hypothetical protein
MILQVQFPTSVWLHKTASEGSNKYSFLSGWVHNSNKSGIALFVCYSASFTHNSWFCSSYRE